MSQTNAFKQANNPDRVYYDILQTNIGRDTETPARFIETTDTPIINNTGDYKMSVVRFQIDTPNMPVLIIQPNQDEAIIPNPNLNDNARYTTTDYAMYLGYNGSNGGWTPLQAQYKFFIEWKPEDPNVYKPSYDEYKDGKHINFEYFYCYSYEYFFNWIINNSIKLYYGSFLDVAYTASQNPLLGQGAYFVEQFSNWTYPPTFRWDGASQKVQILVPPCYITTTDNAPYGITEAFPAIINAGNSGFVPLLLTELGVSLNFYTLITTYPAFNKKTLIGAKPYNMLIFTTDFFTNWRKAILPNTNLNYTFSASFAIDPVAFVYTYKDFVILGEQEWSSIDLMTPINSIVFTSNTLPLVLNQQSANQSKNKTDSYLPNTKGSLNQHILTITDLMSNQQGYRPNILYVPSGQYRYITLQGNQPLNQIDINVFYQLKTGELIPFMLTNGGTASIKLLFEKVVLSETEKLQFANMSIRELGL